MRYCCLFLQSNGSGTQLSPLCDPRYSSSITVMEGAKSHRGRVHVTEDYRSESIHVFGRQEINHVDTDDDHRLALLAPHDVCLPI
jgi:hypothetical protein